MKQTLIALALLAAVGANAEIKPIKLNEPNLNRGTTVMQALKNRQSVREFSDAMLSQQDLSDLLWAATGVNRPDGKMTAATCMGKNDVDVYALTAEGAYKYVPATHTLMPVAEGDHRDLIRGGQSDFPLPPVALLMVSVPTRIGGNMDAGSQKMGTIDASLVAQNVMVFCAGNGMVTVPRASWDEPGIRKLLNLGDDTILVLNQPVGYPKK